MKPCIIIGSGSDLNGRKLGAAIDAGEFGEVVRVNKFYGELADVGVRTDWVFTLAREFFLTSCVRRFGHPLKVGRMVETRVSRRNMAPRLFRAALIDWLDLKSPSAGIEAVFGMVGRGYLPTLIGYGFKGGAVVNRVKTYCDGRKDTRMYGEHDYDRENEMLLKLAARGLVRLP